MSHLSHAPAGDASGEVRDMYLRLQQAWGFVPGYAKAFEHRPQVMQRWGALLDELKRPMSPYRFELVTLAAALEMNHTPCALAHGQALLEMSDEATVLAMARGEEASCLSPLDQALVRFARHIVRDAAGIDRAQVTELVEQHGLAAAEVFDVAAAVAGRCFFSKLLDALGVQADTPMAECNAELREALVVGRPVANQPPETLAVKGNDDG